MTLPRAVVLVMVRAERQVEIVVEHVLFEVGQDAGDPAYVVAFGDVSNRALRVDGAGGVVLVRHLVIVHGDDQLAHVVRAHGAAGRFAAGLNRRQQQRHQDSDDRDDDQQFDQGKAQLRAIWRVMIPLPRSDWEFRVRFGDLTRCRTAPAGYSAVASKRVAAGVGPVDTRIRTAAANRPPNSSAGTDQVSLSYSGSAARLALRAGCRPRPAARPASEIADSPVAAFR